MNTIKFLAERRDELQTEANRARRFAADAREQAKVRAEGWDAEADRIEAGVKAFDEAIAALESVARAAEEAP
jgi:pterin-4a-carbinolamine dehydratase